MKSQERTLYNSLFLHTEGNHCWLRCIVVGTITSTAASRTMTNPCNRLCNINRGNISRGAHPRSENANAINPFVVNARARKLSWSIHWLINQE